MHPRTGFLPPSPATWDVAARVRKPRPVRRKPRAGSQAPFLKPGILQKPTFAMHAILRTLQANLRTLDAIIRTLTPLLVPLDAVIHTLSILRSPFPLRHSSYPDYDYFYS